MLKADWRGGAGAMAQGWWGGSKEMRREGGGDLMMATAIATYTHTYVHAAWRATVLDVALCASTYIVHQKVSLVLYMTVANLVFFYFIFLPLSIIYLFIMMTMVWLFIYFFWRWINFRNARHDSSILLLFKRERVASNRMTKEWESLVSLITWR